MTTGKLLIAIGVLIALIGVVLTYAPNLFGWFGRLPGDIRIEKENGFFFFPITSMIVISVVVTIIINLLFRK